MFDLLSPCKSCPFRKDTGHRFGLCRERIEEIADAPAFQCHATVDYSENEFGDEFHRQGDNPQQCAGLMSILISEDRPNTIMQVASRLNSLDFDKVDPRRLAYGSIEEAIETHSR